MSQPAQALEHASVRQYCKAVKVPVMAANFVRLAEQAVKENRSHIGYLEALLAMESEERDRHALGASLTSLNTEERQRVGSVKCSDLVMFSTELGSGERNEHETRGKLRGETRQ